VPRGSPTQPPLASPPFPVTPPPTHGVPPAGFGAWPPTLPEVLPPYAVPPPRHTPQAVPTFLEGRAEDDDPPYARPPDVYSIATSSTVPPLDLTRRSPASQPPALPPPSRDGPPPPLVSPSSPSSPYPFHPERFGPKRAGAAARGPLHHPPNPSSASPPRAPSSVASSSPSSLRPPSLPLRMPSESHPSQHPPPELTTPPLPLSLQPRAPSLALGEGTSPSDCDALCGEDLDLIFTSFMAPPSAGGPAAEFAFDT
jgi:hypothetical protein